ncbi:MAG: ABC transporter permease subunit [Firmicutes bacterium]|nr:ABC transporter permease subunit [Bacillota bacterium]
MISTDKDRGRKDKGAGRPGVRPLQERKILRGLAALVFWVAVWTATALITGKALILPSPLAVVRALLRMGGTSVFWLSAGSSLLRIACGFLAGVLLGAGLAVLTSVSKTAETLLAPAIRVIRATPVASFIILVLLWASRAMVTGVIAALMVLPVIWEQLSAAIASVDKGLLELARVYRFGRRKTVRLVYLPSVLPSLVAACLTAQGLAWKSGVAAEVITLPRSSIGTQLYYSKLYLNTDELFAWTLTVILLSFLLELLCRFAFKHLQGGRAHV